MQQTVPRRSDSRTSSPWLPTCPGSLTVLCGSPLPPRRSRLTSGSLGRGSVSDDVVFFIILKASPSPVIPKDLDSQVRKAAQEAPPTWAVLPGHQEACLKTGHCHTCWPGPGVWLGLRLYGHLSEGDGVGARFPKKQGQTSAPSQRKAAGTVARREGAI